MTVHRSGGSHHRHFVPIADILEKMQQVTNPTDKDAQASVQKLIADAQAQATAEDSADQAVGDGDDTGDTNTPTMASDDATSASAQLDPSDAVALQAQPPDQALAENTARLKKANQREADDLASKFASRTGGLLKAFRGLTQTNTDLLRQHAKASLGEAANLGSLADLPLTSSSGRSAST